MLARIPPSLIVVVVLAMCANAAERERINIVLILADDLGYGDLGCYGQKKIKTPALDRMAAEGIRFTQFYAGATVCAPSRSVLMAGQHTGHTRVRGNAGSDIQTLRPADVTVAEVLKHSGYATALCGKWGLGDVGNTGRPNDQGFDYFFGYLNQAHAHNYYPEFLWRNEGKVPLRNVVERTEARPGRFRGGWATKRIDYSHDIIVQEGREWIDAHKDEPFFLYLALTIPHANNEGTRGTGNGQEVSEYGIYADRDWSEPNKGQAAMISRMDADVGRLLSQLRELGIAENTLVVFTSDNGHHREGGNDPEFFDANGPLRGMKRDLYEGGIRVPTLAWWPGTISAGTVSDHIGYFGDFMATACELAGAELPNPSAGLDSISFLPTLLGQPEEQRQHQYLYWEFYEQGSKQAVRFGEWKAVRMPMRTGDIELYNLEKDLGEMNNVASEHPQIVQQAAEYLEEAHVPSPLWKTR